VLIFALGMYDAFAEQGLVELIFSGYNALLVDTLVFFIVLISFGRVRKFVLQSFSLAPLRSLRTYTYIAVGFITFATTQYFLIGVWGIDDASAQATDLGADNLESWFSYMLFYLAIVILTPIKEEIMFRGIIHRFLEVRHHFWFGLIASSLIFGVLHFGFPLSATIMGVILVVLYKLTNSLIPPILLHVAWNLMGVLSFTL
jgi:membrane protease YdiL (CAAX protease family)